MSARNASFNRTAPVSLAVGMAGAMFMAMAGCDDQGNKPAVPAAPVQASAAPAEFVDTGFGFRATPPSGWRTVPSEGVQVPGKVIKVWTPGNSSTVVAFVQEAGQPVTAKQLLDSSAAAMKASGCRVSLEEVATVSGKDAMSLKVTGPGSGAALGNGNIPTYQHWIAIPKQNRVLVLLLTSPDASKSDAATAFEAMVRSVKVD